MKVKKLGALVCSGIAVALFAAPGASAQVNQAEIESWSDAWGRTVADFTNPTKTAGVVTTSAENVLRSLQEPDDIARRGPYQLGHWPWSGDPERQSWDGQKIEVLFANTGGGRLAGTVWAPSAENLARSGFDAPLPGVVINEGFQGNQPMYYWAAQGLADAGYVVFTFDVPGQGKSDNQSGGNSLAQAIDFFTSTPDDPYARPVSHEFNPLHELLDRDRIGTAGHSAGAGAVQSLAGYGGRVKAIVAWSDLGSGYQGNVPIQGQGADYDTWILPPMPSGSSNPDGKLNGFRSVRNRGVDVQEIVIQSGTHLAWAHVPWSYTSVWSEDIALHYTLAWYDKYLAGDHERDGETATERLTAAWATDEGNGLSKKFRSAYWVRDSGDPAVVYACDDMRSGADCTRPERGGDPDPDPKGPASRAECRNGGWKQFEDPSFRNQGECVSYVANREGSDGG